MSEKAVELVPITHHVVKNKEFNTNFGGISLDDFTVAVDSGGSSVRGPYFRKALDNWFNLPVKYIIITHYHSDHRQRLDQLLSSGC